MEDGFGSDLNVGPSAGAGATSAAIDEARFANVITMPIQFIGTICNIVVLWVWSAEPVYVPSTYLFKALAVSDILYLQFAIVHCVYWYPGYTHDRVLFGGVFLSIMAFGNLRNGLQISLVLATIRVIKLFFPHHARHLLAKSRIRIVVICCLIYSIGLQTFENTRLIYLPEDNPTAMIWQLYIRAGWGYLLPASLQIVLMLVVACKVLRQRAKTAPLVVNLSSRRRSVEKSQTKVDRNPCFPIKTESRQFVYVAFAICSMSCVAFVLPAIAFIAVGKDDQARKKTRAIAIALTSINCSVNIIFYLLIPRFRYIFADSIDRLMQKVGVLTTVKTSSELVTTAASRRNTGGKDGEGDCERTETDQEEGIAETDNNLADRPALKRLAKKGDSTCTT